MTISRMVECAHETAREKGWWDDRDGIERIPEIIALIHSEGSEALEAYRTPRADWMEWHGDSGKPEGFASELADILIRVGDLCGALGIDLETAVRSKMSYNETRSYRHGGKRA